MAAAHPSPAEMARELINSGMQPRATWAGHDLGAIAWALKDECYAAWNSQPQRAVLAAQALRNLCDFCTEGLGPVSEIQALADWTAGIAAVTAGRLLDAVQFFDRAHDAFCRLGQVHHAAATQVPRIMALSMLGRYDDAIACAEHTQRAFVGLRDSRAAAKVSLNLGGLHLLRGSYAQSVRHSREAAVLFARVGDHEHSVMADNNMASALSWLGDFDEALRIYARAEMRATAHGFPVLQALVAEAVALVRFARGQFGVALAGFEQARRRYEQLAMPRQQAVAEKQLADTYLELNLLPEALALFEVTLARFRSLSLHTEEPWTLAQLGRAQSRLGQPGAALASFVQAGELFATQGNVVGQAAVNVARAELALAAGEVGAALELAAQAARGFAAVSQLEGGLRADVVRAHALLQAGSTEQAQALFGTSLARAREARLLTLQVRCLTGQGLVAQGQGQAQAAHDAFGQAVALFEQQRRALPDDTLRSAFLSDHLRPYQELLRLALDAHTQQASPERAAHVLRMLDSFRASALGERMASAGHGPAGGIDSAATHSLRTRLNWLHRQVQRQREEGAPAAPLVEEMRRTEHALLEQARRERLGSSTQSSGAGDGGFDPTELQQQLGLGDALVEYGVQDDELFACVVLSTGVSLHRRVARWSEVLEALRSVRFQIESLRHGAAPVEQHLAHLTQRAHARLRRLHALVWQPLVPVLGACQRVLVVPHAQLGTLPFAALDDGQGCLAERHTLAIAPSARLALYGLLRQPAPTTCALVMGETTRLAHAAEEARAVADLFGSEVAAMFIGKTASIDTLRQQATNADVIHLACHAQFRRDNPSFSALHLHDGALTVDLIESLGLKAATVVLSGCETGLADASGGDEMVGLVRAFMVAGAARVVASLWPVDDAVTAVFMAHFYGALKRGQAPAAALREAQMNLMRRSPHPLYWAAFTLYGGW